MNNMNDKIIEVLQDLTTYGGETRFMLFGLIDVLAKKGVIDWEDYNDIRNHVHIVNGDSNNETIHE